jgi:hypothetical protein
MITIDLRDERLIDNFQALKELKQCGYSDGELQTLYDQQQKTDAAYEGDEEGAKR